MFTARPALRARPVVLAALALITTAAALVVPAQSDRAEAAIGPISWQDEFNGPAGSAVDQSKWRFDIGGGGWGNNERQYYTNSTSNAALDGQGNLVITARRENPANYQCRYGTLRVHLGPAAHRRQRSPRRTAGSRPGSRSRAARASGRRSGCSATTSAAPGGPTSGEIDIMENIGREPSTVHGTIHGPGYSGCGGIGAGYPHPRRPGVRRRLPHLRGRLGAELDHLVPSTASSTTATTPADLGGNRWVFDHPFFMILNVAVGGYWPGDPDGSTHLPAADGRRLRPGVTPDHRRRRRRRPAARSGAAAASASTSPGRNPADGATAAALGLQRHRRAAVDLRHRRHGPRARQVHGPAWAGTANGTEVQLVNCNGNPAQRFTLTGAGDLVNLRPTSAWTSGTATRTTAPSCRLWDCTGGANQKWSRAEASRQPGTWAVRCPPSGGPLPADGRRSSTSAPGCSTLSICSARLKDSTHDHHRRPRRHPDVHRRDQPRRPEAFAAAFTDDADLNDWGREFHGRDGVRAWDRTDNIGVQAHFDAASGSSPARPRQLRRHPDGDRQRLQRHRPDDLPPPRRPDREPADQRLTPAGRALVQARTGGAGGVDRPDRRPAAVKAGGWVRSPLRGARPPSPAAPWWPPDAPVLGRRHVQGPLQRLVGDRQRPASAGSPAPPASAGSPPPGRGDEVPAAVTSVASMAMVRSRPAAPNARSFAVRVA